ncbi:hypothetical protein M4Z82_28055, partial [Escherichia coli]|nr:hypothetical protein [Escherichia coli]
ILATKENTSQHKHNQSRKKKHTKSSPKKQPITEQNQQIHQKTIIPNEKKNKFEPRQPSGCKSGCGRI